MLETLLDLINQIGPPLIAFVVPLLVAGFKKLLPFIPKTMLPVLAASLGPLGDALVAHLQGIEASPLLAALFGLAGVGVRELVVRLLPLLRSGKTAGDAGQAGFVRARLLAVIVAASAIVLLAGCGGGAGAPTIDAKTPTERLAVVEVEFTNAVATLNDLRDQGVIADGSALEAKAQTAVRTISALLDQAGLAIDSAQYGDFETYVAAANRALLELLQLVEEKHDANSGIDPGGAARHASLAHQLNLDAPPGAGFSRPG